MERLKTLLLIVVAIFFILLPETGSQPWPYQQFPPRPLCSSQIALANYACAALPYVMTPPPSPPSPTPGPPSPGNDQDYDHNHNDHELNDNDHNHDHNDHEHDHDHNQEHDNDHNHNQEHDNDHNHDHEHDHHQRHHHGHGHHHHHGHRHHRGHGEYGTREENCCRWLKSVDNECVCDILVHLPTFLAKPVHDYTVHVRDTCNITYSCSARLKG